MVFRATIGFLLFVLLIGGQESTAQSTGEVLFADDFESAALGSAWTWLRPSAEGRALRDGALHLRTNGNLWQAQNTQRNLLLTSVGDGSRFVVEVNVQNRGDFTERYEHGGIIWYWDDDNWVTLTQLNHVQDKTQKIMIVHETQGSGRARESVAEPYKPSRVELRLVVEGLVFTGFYRETDKTPWIELGSITFPEDLGPPRVGLTAGQGSGHWVTFDDFELRADLGRTRLP